MRTSLSLSPGSIVWSTSPRLAGTSLCIDWAGRRPSFAMPTAHGTARSLFTSGSSLALHRDCIHWPAHLLRSACWSSRLLEGLGPVWGRRPPVSVARGPAVRAGLQGFSSAPERSRTSTDHAVHKALNLARLPVPPQAPVRPILDRASSPLLPSARGVSLRTCVPVMRPPAPPTRSREWT